VQSAWILNTLSTVIVFFPNDNPKMGHTAFMHRNL